MCWICFLTVGGQHSAPTTHGKGQLTREEKQHEPVHNQDRPEDGHVENLKPAAHEGDGDGAGGRVPELELGEPADERAELLILLGRESADGAILHVVVHGLVGGVELGLEEGEKKVEEVDAEGICDCWPLAC